MENILITGSNGFLGSHLIDWCISKDYEIYGLDRPSASYKNLLHYTDGRETFTKKDIKKIFGEKIQIKSNHTNLTFLTCDLKNSELLEKIIHKLQPTFIFHLGAQPNIIPSWENPTDTIETNVIGTINVFEPIKKNNLSTRVILACTSAEFGTTTELRRPLKETDPLLAIHPYGISKVAADLLSRQYFLNFDIESVNLRFFNITGPRKVNDAASDFIRKVAQIDLGLVDPVIEVGNLSPYRDILDIQDALSAIWLAATKGNPGEVYHICSGEKIQIRELLDIALSFSSNKIEVVENVKTKLRKTDEDIIVGDNSKFKTELHWEKKIPIQDTLKKMYDYWINYYQTMKS
jgi:GDP-4-dehydro-6-deoxy-D-mannose reductase